MRRMMLAAALLATCASSAFAQIATKMTPGVTHRATYAPKAASPVRYVGARHLESTIEGGGCTSCAAPASSCTSGGCNDCRSHCPLPPLFPCLADNVADLFARLKPCPGPCSPCRRTVHCCPYPKTMPPTNCCRPRLPNLLDTIFVCNKCCPSKCHSGCSTGGCTSCASGGLSHGTMMPEELSPPSPPPMMKENPFPDDPEMKGAKRRTGTKTAATPRSWYKTRAAASISDAPETIVIGNASPLRVRE